MGSGAVMVIALVRILIVGRQAVALSLGYLWFYLGELSPLSEVTEEKWGLISFPNYDRIAEIIFLHPTERLRVKVHE